MNSYAWLGIMVAGVAVAACSKPDAGNAAGSAAASAGAADATRAPAGGKKKPADAALAMDRTVAKAAKGAREAKLDPKEKKHQTFLAALKKTERSVDALQKEAGKKGAGYDKALFRTAAAVSQLEASKTQLGASNATLDQAVASLSSTTKTLKRSSGKLGARKNKGGPLADAEQQALRNLRADAQAAKPKLASVKSKAKSKDAAAEIDRIDRDLAAILTGELTVDAYLEALAAVSEVEGRWASTASFLRLTEPALAADLEAVSAALMTADALYLDALEAMDLDAATFDEELELAEIDAAIAQADLESLDDYVEHLDVPEIDPFGDADCDGELDTTDLDDDGDGTPDASDDDDDNDGTPDAADPDDRLPPPEAAGADDDDGDDPPAPTAPEAGDDD